jgi:hypothetical protein
MLRINVDRADPGKNYSIPAGNMFVNSSTGLEEIWATGNKKKKIQVPKKKKIFFLVQVSEIPGVVLLINFQTEFFAGMWGKMNGKKYL